MTDFVTRGPTHLGADRVATAPTAQALYDNSSAVAEGKTVPSGFAVGSTRLLSGSTAVVATLDFDLTPYTDWKHILILLSRVLPATDGAALLARVSTNGGSSYDTGASQYRYNQFFSTGGNQNVTSSIEIANAVGNQTGEGLMCEFTLYDRLYTGWNPKFFSKAVFNDSVPNTEMQIGGWERLTMQDTDAIRFLFSSGNIAEAQFEIYGWN